tara:strand:+ start:109 stop:354 length:246 start_codon:yes stop_codon:yes gene_type:complete
MNNLTMENKLKIKKEAKSYYQIIFNNDVFNVCQREDETEWEIRDEAEIWIHTVRTLKDAKLLITNCFDWDRAFGKGNNTAC